MLTGTTNKRTIIKSLLATVAILIISAFNVSAMLPVAQGNTNSILGKYTVEKADMLNMIQGEALRTYTIKYENAEDSLLVVVDDSREELKFLVISDQLMMEYKCENNLFGAKIVSEYFQNEGYFTHRENLDRKQYFHQKLITQHPKSETEYISLISVYFPKLIMNTKKLYVNK